MKPTINGMAFGNTTFKQRGNISKKDIDTSVAYSGEAQFKRLVGRRAYA